MFGAMHHFISVFHCFHFYSQFKESFFLMNWMNCCRTCQALCKTFPYGENMEGIIVRKIVFRFTAIKPWAENGSPELLEPGFLRHSRSLSAQSDL